MAQAWWVFEGDIGHQNVAVVFEGDTSAPCCASYQKSIISSHQNSLSSCEFGNHTHQKELNVKFKMAQDMVGSTQTFEHQSQIHCTDLIAAPPRKGQMYR